MNFDAPDTTAASLPIWRRNTLHMACGAILLLTGFPGHAEGPDPAVDGHASSGGAAAPVQLTGPEISLWQLRLETLYLPLEERRDALLAWDVNHGPALAEAKKQRWQAILSQADPGSVADFPATAEAVAPDPQADIGSPRPLFSQETLSRLEADYAELTRLRSLHAHDPEALQAALLQRDEKTPREIFPAGKAPAAETAVSGHEAFESVILEASPASPQPVKDWFSLRQEMRDRLHELPRPLPRPGQAAPTLEDMEAWREAVLAISGDFQDPLSLLHAEIERSARQTCAESLQSPISLPIPNPPQSHE